MLYWSGFTDSAVQTVYDDAFTLGSDVDGGMAFMKITDVDDDAQMYVNEVDELIKISWRDVRQSENYDNSYLMAAMSSVSTYPDKILQIFQNEENDYGIYSLQFFIRGKPWLVTIDDSVLV